MQTILDMDTSARKALMGYWPVGGTQHSDKEIHRKNAATAFENPFANNGYGLFWQPVMVIGMGKRK